MAVSISNQAIIFENKLCCNRHKIFFYSFTFFINLHLLMYMYEWVSISLNQFEGISHPKRSRSHRHQWRMLSCRCHCLQEDRKTDSRKQNKKFAKNNQNHYLFWIYIYIQQLAIKTRIKNAKLLNQVEDACYCMIVCYIEISQFMRLKTLINHYKNTYKQ